jgi:hypothetical protein
VSRATEFTVMLEDRPGTLAEMTEALGNAGVNIDGMQAMPCGGQGVIQMIIPDADKAVRALDGGGIKYTRREVLLLSLEDKPGSLARVARAMSDAGINLNAGYVTMARKVVLGVDNLAGAEDVARKLGVL